ncbi:hypothetical protein TNCT_99521 [Trichonephila clavata]|uniref:Uncharacterized protein n=1 Tax=Trichonephila clavata TaxID=2740835 RepID=A0A8X6M0F6_TRICU|nr:hypothetical protein TNCT_99521 [Trichonephila clavata]
MDQWLENELLEKTCVVYSNAEIAESTVTGILEPTMPSTSSSIQLQPPSTNTTIFQFWTCGINEKISREYNSSTGHINSPILLLTFATLTELSFPRNASTTSHIGLSNLFLLSQPTNTTSPTLTCFEPTLLIC